MLIDPEDLDIVAQERTHDRPVRAYAPNKSQKIRSFTVCCLVLNRTIGTGIFATPTRLLKGTGSIGVSLIFWALGALTSTCALLVWLEFGLSIPREYVGGQNRGVPRSGGEKNFLEHILRKPAFLGTCIYGIIFIILGNLAGNAVAFGKYTMDAANQPNASKGTIVALAIASVTASCLLHVCSRRGGIIVNNVFAVLKVAFLLTIIILGFAYRAGHDFGAGVVLNANFNSTTIFANPRPDLASYSDSFMFVLYTYSGYEQPFYVLSEVRQPRKTFPRAVLVAINIAASLFLLVNAAFFCVVPKEILLDGSDSLLIGKNNDIALIFFHLLFGNELAPRVMSGAIALTIFGNLVVMAFTASRVKQELAKEAILPWSLFFATGYWTPFPWIRARWRARRSSAGTQRSNTDTQFLENGSLYQSRIPLLEQISPTGALCLHWFSTIFLIAVTSKLDAGTQYSLLVSLYSYVIIVLLSFLVTLGLLYLKLCNYFPRLGRQWVPEFYPWGGPAAPILYLLVSGFLLVTSFLQPADDSPYSYKNNGNIQWYVVPVIGVTSLLWGVIWWMGLHIVMWKRGQQLVVNRTPYCEKDGQDDEWVMKYEIIDHVWHVKLRGNSDRARSLDMDSLERESL